MREMGLVSMIFRAALLLAGCAVPVAGFGQSLNGALTPQECAFIERYDRENETYDFASDFAYMAHFSDLDAPGGCRNCFGPLRKRHLDLEVSIIPNRDFLGDAAVYGVTQVRALIEYSMPLTYNIRSINDPYLGDGGILVFFFVDQYNRPEIENFFSGHPVTLSIIDALSEPETTCFVGRPEWTAFSEAAPIFIDAEHHNLEDQVVSCMREFGFHALGLFGEPQGDQSLFSDERWRGPPAPPPTVFHYGDQDLVMMRLFYRPEFEHGQLHAETLAEITQMIAEECPNNE